MSRKQTSDISTYTSIAECMVTHLRDSGRTEEAAQLAQQITLFGAGRIGPTVFVEQVNALLETWPSALDTQQKRRGKTLDASALQRLPQEILELAKTDMAAAHVVHQQLKLYHAGDCNHLEKVYRHFIEGTAKFSSLPPALKSEYVGAGIDALQARISAPDFVMPSTRKVKPESSTRLAPAPKEKGGRARGGKHSSGPNLRQEQPPFNPNE